jgi:hypothetical protein
MWPRLMFVVGLTVGVMAPIVWAGFNLPPTRVSHVDRTARIELNPYSAPSTDHTPVKSETAKKPTTAKTIPETKSFSSPLSPLGEHGTAQVRKPEPPPVESQKTDRSTAELNRSHAPAADNATARAGGKNHDTADESRSSIPSMPASPSSTEHTTPLSTASSLPRAETRRPPSSKKSSRTRHRREVVVRHRVYRSPDTVIVARGFCVNGAYLTCTGEYCWGFCY